MPPSQAQTGTQAQSTGKTGTQIQNTPHLLLCEALGFSPQLLLDDIINIANNAAQDGVNGMEEFLRKWADERVSNPSGSKHKDNQDQNATTHEVEQGLAAFQTLLEYHADIAFDYFEAWCLRNSFMIPHELSGSIVLPHQEGLDLSVTPEEEQAAIEEVEELRRRLDGHRNLNRLLTRAIRTSTRQLTHAESRLSSLSHLSSLAPSPSRPSRHDPAPLPGNVPSPVAGIYSSGQWTIQIRSFLVMASGARARRSGNFTVRCASPLPLTSSRMARSCVTFSP
ncbi:hypothetical protein GALMADRAFT_225635 [Galerina marginata CBS 339.88]|uniref:Mis12 domain-containing protein n=1 Tax=Galerina marginata (strain CBS 339.88) TaxID=685588 RepID=A0A067T9U2_GALM3|nr:hypothetical protein GALMADRAFT_225635 [Galerina marginata CBS 339.88]